MTYTEKFFTELIKEVEIGFNSTCIASIYVEPMVNDTDTEILINFISGGQYSYTIDIITMVKVLNYDSIGKAYHRYIRGKYQSQRM